MATASMRLELAPFLARYGTVVALLALIAVNFAVTPNFASLQTLKAHVQEYPGCQRFDVFIRAESNGDVLLHCYTTWDTPWQLEAFLERGYTLERLLADLGERAAERSLVMEKVF